MSSQILHAKRRKLNFEVSGPPPFSTIGLFTYLRTYARRHDENDIKSTIESWAECIERVVRACNNQLKAGFTDDEQHELFQILYNLKCSVAGRFMWQLGSKTVDRLGLPSLQNCSAVVVDDPIRPFVWAMDMLMLGSGVGFRVLPSDVEKLPVVKYALNRRMDVDDADFIVPDSREGWVKLYGKVLKSHFYSGKSFTYSCHNLRSKGAPIKSFGGTSSGPDTLYEGMLTIDEIMNRRAGQKLRPVDILDIFCAIGRLVVSGNIRRSALICLGDCKDTDYLRAKRWDLGSIPNYRAYSNNSVVCNDINDVLENKEFWEGFNGNGEPYGLINLKLSQSCGRLGETQYSDPGVVCYNPCVSGDTMVHTAEGLVAVRYLVGKQFTAIVDAKPYLSTEKGFWSTGVKPVYKVVLENGVFLKATGNHKLYAYHDEKIDWYEISQLLSGDFVYLSDNRITGHYADPRAHDVGIDVQSQYDAHFQQLLLLTNGVDSVVQKDKLTSIMFTEDIVGYMSQKVVSITPCGEEEVYDCTISEVHCFSANGIKAHNCAEISLNNYQTCVSGDTLIHTLSGVEPIRNLVDRKVKIFNGEVWSEVTPFLARENDEFLEVQFSDGSMLKVTPYHEFSVSSDGVNFEKLKADQLKPGMEMPEFTLPETIGTVCIDPDSSYQMGTWRCYDNNTKGLSTNILSFCADSVRHYVSGMVDTIGRQEASLYIVPGKNLKLLQDLQILLRRAGIRATIYEHELLIPTGTLPTRIIKGKFATDFSKPQPVVIVSVQKSTPEASFCFSEPLKHMGVFGNVLTYQCCLSELYLPNIKTKEELLKCATYMYRVCKHSLTLPCTQSKETERIVHEQSRIGIGVTGYLQSTDEQKNWLSDCYKHLREYDKRYSMTHGLPVSIKLTTTKPSGTLSLLGGTTSGVHPAYSQYYLRRIRVSSDSALLPVAEKHGYPVEYSRGFDGSIDHTTKIITFPCKVPEGTILAENCTAIQQLEWVKRLQTEWADNAVSVTVYYRKEELSEIKEWLRKNYNNGVKTVSFLLHTGHNFAQAPLESITKEQFEELNAKCRPITDLKNITYTEELLENLAQECAGGACPIR